MDSTQRQTFAGEFARPPVMHAKLYGRTLSSGTRKPDGARRGAICLWILIVLLTAFSSPGFPEVLAQDGSTTVTDVRAVGTDLWITVRLAPGPRRLTLETRPRLGEGAWKPREVRWSEGNEADVTFVLPLGEGMEMLRVRDEALSELALPSSFFSGQKEFGPVPTSSTGGNYRMFGDVHGAGPGAADSTAETGGQRTVVESDIWYLDGDTWYFFNQQRGLQVIDISQPEAPRLSGTLPLLSWGEQMYRLPAKDPEGAVWVALLTQQACTSGSELILVRVDNGQPSLRRRLDIPGQIRESRLVGDALYVASYEWWQPAPLERRDEHGKVIGYEYFPWQSRTVISAFDLADPSVPVVRDPVELAASPDAIAATDRFLLVAATGTTPPDPLARIAAWALQGNHAVHVFDISDPRGVTRPEGWLLTAGRVADKFKLGLTQEVLTVVSQTDSTGQWVETPEPGGKGTRQVWQWTPPSAVLETFSLADPSAPDRLAGLTLVTNESVFGTRFDGDRAYVITFRQVDPLWIVDLSDPARPRVRGELEVPGFSQYLHPLGDRLLAMGVEGSRAAVSLFDVGNPDQPALLNKVFLGEGWSASEANWDEKAFRVFPEAGLVLVPWSGQRASPGEPPWFNGVQLVDLERDQLILRGVIEHDLQARRATLMGERILSLSARELLGVNAAQRDHPVVESVLELAPEVDRVILDGSQLLLVRNGGSLPPQITLAAKTDPEASLARLVLAGPPVVGATVRQGRLYLLQVQPDQWQSREIWRTNRSDAGQEVVTKEWNYELMRGETWLSVVEVGAGFLTLRGQTQTPNLEQQYAGEWKALWPQDGVVVWTQAGNGGYGFYPWLWAAVDFAPGRPGLGWDGFWWWGGTTRHFLGYGVTDPGTPVLASTRILGAENEGGTWDTFSESFVAAGKIFTSRTRVQMVPVNLDPTKDPKDSSGVVQEAQSSWWLDVADYSDPTVPVVWAPANLPGDLVGLSHGGEMLYTQVNQADSKGSQRQIQALAYDGIQASLAATLELPLSWPQPALVRDDGVVWLGRAPAATGEAASLETWRVGDDGSFVALGRWETPQPVSEVIGFDEVIVASDGSSWLRFLDPTRPTAWEATAWEDVPVTERPCGLWIPGWASAADLSSGLWIPRNLGGVWHIPLAP